MSVRGYGQEQYELLLSVMATASFFTRTARARLVLAVAGTSGLTATTAAGSIQLCFLVVIHRMIG